MGKEGILFNYLEGRLKVSIFIPGFFEWIVHFIKPSKSVQRMRKTGTDKQVSPNLKEKFAY